LPLPAEAGQFIAVDLYGSPEAQRKAGYRWLAYIDLGFDRIDPECSACETCEAVLPDTP
jgi:hypothetical protein